MRVHGSLGLLVGVLGLLSPWSARASHWTVNGSGVGDFTTIQAALGAEPRDTILVSPGSYPEILSFGTNRPAVVIVGIAGAASTQVTNVTAPLNSQSHLASFRGISFVERLELGYPANASVFDFRQCRFMGGIFARSQDGGGNIHDSDFYGPAAFMQYGNSGAFTGLRFHSARLYVAPSGTGPIVMSNCSFEGPGDTLVVAQASPGDNPLIFRDCTFASAHDGIVFPPSYDGTNEITRCRFSDLSGAAIRYEPGSTPHCGPSQCISDQGVIIDDSRFERCGQAVRWLTIAPSRIFMRRDTVLASTGIALEVSPGLNFSPTVPSFRDLIVDGGTSHGFVARLTAAFSSFWLKDSRFTNLGGDGVQIAHAQAPENFFASRVTHCVSSGNSGDGFHVADACVTLAQNVAFDNGGDGIDFLSTATPGPDWSFAPPADSIVSNTAAMNRGDGIRVQRVPSVPGISQVIQKNICAGNSVAGLRAGLHSATSVAFNDAWQNYLGNYVGLAFPADSNLTTDPQFCDFANGVLGLQEGSPCSAVGVYGALGALPVACPSTTGVPTSGSTLRLSVGPNPARGVIHFSSPKTSAGRLEVFDAQGRLAWRADLRAGEVLRWHGGLGADRLPAGAYLARWSNGSTESSARFVWLR